MWYIYTMELFGNNNKKCEVLIHATTQMNFENITLSGKKPVKKDNVLYDYIHEMFGKCKSVETESRFFVAQGQRWEDCGKMAKECWGAGIGVLEG